VRDLVAPPIRGTRASRAALCSALAAVATSGCGDSQPQPPVASYDGPPIPWAYEAFPEVAPPADNPSTAEKIELGRLLFYDPILSRDRKVACATCHSEIWGMGDGLGVSVGVDGVGPTGPGRDGPNKTRRNSPTLWNVALRESLFWDGRSPSLEEQALAPVTDPIELDRDMGELMSDLEELPGYRTLFEAAFPDEPAPISPENLARAVAAFERTMISRHAPYDRYVAGDAGALKPEVIRGMFLFAEAGCEGCHRAPRFESEVYAERGASGAAGDEGRFEVTGSVEDRGRFRVPTLRNLRETGPYFHGGAIATLDEAVAHEVAIAVERGESRSLSSDEVVAIALFLRKALMDRSLEPDRPESVPSGLEVPEDGFRIVR
jgi:cytochrome c peroxidase